MKLPHPKSEGSFVIHAHKATKLHWDLRLEVPADKEDFENMDIESYKKLGINVNKKSTVMWSFAIPKARFPEVKEKILAIETEPHPVEYNFFEGKIPAGMYGAGDVSIYDRGKVKWIQVQPKKVLFELNGEKIKGKFILLLFKEDKKEGRKWLLLRAEQDS